MAYAEIEFGLQFENRPETIRKLTVGKFAYDDQTGQPSFDIEGLRARVKQTRDGFYQDSSDPAGDGSNATPFQIAMADSDGNRLENIASLAVTVVNRIEFDATGGGD